MSAGLTMAAIAATYFAATIVHAMACAGIGTWLGARPTLIKLGGGKAVGEWNWRGVIIVLGRWPIASSVRFVTESIEGSQSAWSELPVWRRALTILAGPLTNLTLGLILSGALGPQRLLASVVGFLHGAIHPLEFGVPQLVRIVDAAQFSSIGSLIGLVLIFAATLSLMPIPPTAGADALLALVMPATRVGDQVRLSLSRGGLVLWLGAMAMWLLAFLFSMRQWFA